MDRDMVPPQSETAQQFSTPHYIKEFYSHKIEDITGDNILSKKSSSDGVFLNLTPISNNIDQQSDEKPDVFYLRARAISLACGFVPNELELRETGVFAKIPISKGTRYGPFQGKWASVPQYATFAWEVSSIFFNSY